MPRGGSRKHPADCKCGNCPKFGRPKVARLSNPNTSAKILRDMRCEEVEKACIAIEMKRLGIDLSAKDYGVSNAPANISILPLIKTIDRLKCHAHGNPHDTVNHLHDKPIQHEVTVSIAEIVRKVRERKQQYERSRT